MSGWGLAYCYCKIRRTFPTIVEISFAHLRVIQSNTIDYDTHEYPVASHVFYLRDFSRYPDEIVIARAFKIIEFYHAQ